MPDPLTPPLGATPVAVSAADAPPARPAATILLLRDADSSTTGMEVLMLRRHARSGFAASAWVFPGGVVDAADAALPPGHHRGLDPQAVASRFALSPLDTLAMHVAAVRETFEEAGVLLATTPEGEVPSLAEDRLVALRRDLNDREVEADFTGFLIAHDLVLDLGQLTYWLRWVTPVQEPRRYDTCFFLARVPPDAKPVHDAVETTETRWVNPVEAIAPDSDLHVIFPTRKTLEWMAPHKSAAALLAHARALGNIPALQPHILLDEHGAYSGILMPDDEGYPAELVGEG